MAISKKSTGNEQLTTTGTGKPKGKLPHIKIRIKEKGQEGKDATFVSCWGQGLTEKGSMKFSGKLENTYFDVFLDDQYYTEDYENILKEAEEKAAKFAQK